MATAINNNLHNQLPVPKESDLVLHKTPGTQGDGGTSKVDFLLALSSSCKYFQRLLNRCHMHQFETLIPPGDTHWKVMIQSRTKNLQGKNCSILVRKQHIQSKGSKPANFGAKKYNRAERKG